jgi:hypothetical protein
MSVATFAAIKHSENRLIFPTAPTDDYEFGNLIWGEGFGEVLPDLKQQHVVFSWLNGPKGDKIGSAMHVPG